MSTISVTNINDGDAVTAASINNQVNTIVNDYNGNITATNLAANAVTDAKITANNLLATKISNLYKFRVYLAGVGTSTSGNKLVTFDTKTYDTSTNYDVATGKFTAPVAGWYRFYSLISASGTPGTAWQSFIYKNGSVISNGINGAAASNVTSNVYDEVQLAANDYVQIFIGSGGTTTILAGSVTSYFTGSLVSSI